MTDAPLPRHANESRFRSAVGLATVCLVSSFAAVGTVGQDAPTALSGFESSEILDVQDEQAWSAYRPVVSRLLFRTTQMSDASLREFAAHTQGVLPAEISAKPRDGRFRVFELEGRVKSLIDGLPDRRDADLPYQGWTLSRLVADDQSEFVVITPHYPDDDRPPALPDRWPRNTEIDQPVKLFGFFMANVDWRLPDDDAERWKPLGLNKNPIPVLVAPRLDWYPDQTSAAIDVGESQLLLARYGVDIGRLEALRNSSSRKIAAAETDSFYQMLSAASRVGRDELPVTTVDFQACLQHPHDHHGDRVRIVGHVRRVTRLAISDLRIQQRFGLNHYFQLDLFVPLDRQRIVIRSAQPAVRKGDAAEREDSIVHENRYPVTVCVATLPCLPAEMERRQVLVDGFFFKTWNYESELTRQQAGPLQQVSPLIMGLAPQLVAPPPDYISYAIGAGGLALLVGLLLLVWFTLYRPKAVDRERRRRLPAAIEIAEPPAD